MFLCFWKYINYLRGFQAVCYELCYPLTINYVQSNALHWWQRRDSFKTKMWQILKSWLNIYIWIWARLTDYQPTIHFYYSKISFELNFVKNMLKTYIFEIDLSSKTKISFLMCSAAVTLVAPSIFHVKNYSAYRLG